MSYVAPQRTFHALEGKIDAVRSDAASAERDLEKIHRDRAALDAKT